VDADVLAEKVAQSIISQSYGERWASDAESIWYAENFHFGCSCNLDFSGPVESADYLILEWAPSLINSLMKSRQLQCRWPCRLPKHITAVFHYPRKGLWNPYKRQLLDSGLGYGGSEWVDQMVSHGDYCSPG
jgi:hypothetical protein